MRATYVYEITTEDGAHDHVRGVEYAGSNPTTAMETALSRARSEWPDTHFVGIRLVRVES